METTTEAPEEFDGPYVDGAFTMVVTLKSGTQIRVQVTDYSIGRNRLGDFARLKWTSAGAPAATLTYVDVDEIVAIHSEWPNE